MQHHDSIHPSASFLPSSLPWLALGRLISALQLHAIYPVMSGYVRSSYNSADFDLLPILVAHADNRSGQSAQVEVTAGLLSVSERKARGWRHACTFPLCQTTTANLSISCPSALNVWAPVNAQIRRPEPLPGDSPASPPPPTRATGTRPLERAQCIHSKVTTVKLYWFVGLTGIVWK